MIRITIKAIDYSRERVFEGHQGPLKALNFLWAAPQDVALVRVDIGAGERVLSPRQAISYLVDEFWLIPAG